jgi:hypothetical protein
VNNAITAFIDAIAALYSRVKNLIFPNISPETRDSNSIDRANQGLMHLNSFNPGNAAPRMQQASFSLNIDGRSLAQSMVDHLESIYGMPTGAPAADGMHSYFGGDHQTTST